jgi:branched-chain amino acid transport system ATP-binding protein
VPALEIKGLAGGWGETTVIENLDLALEAGEAVALVGRNGVGKSTLLELIVGRAVRHGGAIRLDGSDIAPLPTHLRARRGIGHVPQEREVFVSLTVEENLRVAARPGRWNAAAVFELFPGLAQRRGNLGGQLSGGEQQMLSIARALVGNPAVLLMDEPSEGLAPIVVETLTAAIRRVTESRALTVLLVEQRVDIALDIASRCLIMDRGRIVHEGASVELRRDRARLESLLGFEH